MMMNIDVTQIKALTKIVWEVSSVQNTTHFHGPMIWRILKVSHLIPTEVVCLGQTDIYLC